MKNEMIDSIVRSDADADFVRLAVNTLIEELDMTIGRISENTSHWHPTDLAAIRNTLSGLKGCLANQYRDAVRLPNNIPIQALSTMRWAIEQHLEATQIALESTANATHLEEALTVHAQKLVRGRELLKHLDELKVQPAPRLSISNYLNLATIARIPGFNSSLEERQFDDKFHILMSQSLFMKDLRHYREQCSLRGRPVSVAYIDIDKFKEFNTRLTETRVDKDVLPLFQSTLERTVFGRGFAYREGGDEYLVLLPSATHTEAASFFDSLRQDLGKVEYGIGIPGPTVSIGVCTAGATDHLTALQIQSLANLAKEAAKNAGRNKVYGYRRGEHHSQSSLTLLPEASDGPSSI